MVCMVMAFAVAGIMIDVDPFVAGSIGLVATQLPLGLAFAAPLVTGINNTVSESSKELRQKQAEIIKLLEPLKDKKIAEFTEEERNLWQAQYPQFEKVNNDLMLALQQEEVSKRHALINGVDLSKGDKRDIERYSFRKAILAAGTKSGLEGVELEMHQEAVKEARELGGSITGFGVPYMLLSRKAMHRASTGQNITAVADGGYLKENEPLLYFDALRNKILLPGMGAKFLTGLRGDLPLVEGGAFTASWLAEDGEDTATKMTFDQFIMQPKRLQVTGALSMQLVRQSSPDIEALIEDALVAAHAHAYQEAAINGSGTPPTPRGILNKVGIGAVVIGTNGGAPIWKTIIDLETEVAIDNAEGNSMYYLTNAKVRGKLKQTEKTSGNAQYIWIGNEMNGYPAMVTNAVPSNLTKGNQSELCSAIIFGDFSKLYLGQWGNLDIIVDPYSLKKKAELEITVIGYGDVGILQPEAFAACKDATTV